MTDLGASTNLIGGLFYLDNLPNGLVKTFNSQFHNCYSTREGSIFFLN